MGDGDNDGSEGRSRGKTVKKEGMIGLKTGAADG